MNYKNITRKLVNQIKDLKSESSGWRCIANINKENVEFERTQNETLLDLVTAQSKAIKRMADMLAEYEIYFEMSNNDIY